MEKGLSHPIPSSTWPTGNCHFCSRCRALSQNSRVFVGSNEWIFCIEQYFRGYSLWVLHDSGFWKLPEVGTVNL